MIKTKWCGKINCAVDVKSLHEAPIKLIATSGMVTYVPMMLHRYREKQTFAKSNRVDFKLFKIFKNKMFHLRITISKYVLFWPVSGRDKRHVHNGILIDCVI